MDECMLNDVLECSVCLERLDTSSKALPCQHTFCKKCLDEIVCTHRELRCPECRVLVNSKVDDLPPNVLLMRILEGMKNAIPRLERTPTKAGGGNNVQGGGTPQRLVGGAVCPTSSSTHTVITSNARATVTVAGYQDNTGAQVTGKQSHMPNRPYGRAIYDYVSKVPGDLNFRKGDVIILRKKIDNNWYVGECGSSHGVFPLSYVQVVTPLPSHVPQCKALYDFRMMNDDEDGCLTFNKGEVISVIRRVDENWAEGKLLDRIGIFPLAFVELNSVARALMKLSTNVQPGPSRIAPPTPTNEETTPLIPTDHSRTIQSASQSKPPASLNSSVTVSESPNVSSGDSSTTTSSPITTSQSSSNSSTSPSSPSSPAVLPPVATNRTNNNKRHSFTGINSSNQQVQPPQPQHRHSAEILSLDNGIGTVDQEGSGDAAPADMTQSVGSVDQNVRHKRSGNEPHLASSNLMNTSITLPSAYIALYPYKPQKADELELRKGGIYMVTERCQDGWFKGTSNRTQKCGVFPGNYVVPAKFQRSTPRSSNQQSHQSSGSAQNNIGGARATVSYTKNKNSTSHSPNSRSLPPPELPPRSASPNTAWHAQRQGHAQSSPRMADQTTPGNRTGMTAMFVSPGKLPIPTPPSSSSQGLINNSNRSPSNAAAAHSSPTSASTSAASPKPAEKVKEKKDKGVSLMRRLTNMKKSKSPPPTTYSMDNPVFDDGNTSSQSPLVNSAVHVRSGSCPNELLDEIPGQTEIGNSHHRMYPSSIRGSVSQRIKHKERPALPVSFCQRPAETASAGTTSNHHRKSHSLDANMGKQVKQQIFSKDRFRCIVPYPPNSDFELELQVGDIIYVHKKRDDGWYKGTQQRTGRTGLFPASFVEAF